MPEDHHKTQDLSKLDVREIEDGHQPAWRADDYSLPITDDNFPILPTLKWKPANPPPTTFYITTQQPAFVSFVQLESTADFRLMYFDVCQTTKRIDQQ
jgi:hypothetical protein